MVRYALTKKKRSMIRLRVHFVMLKSFGKYVGRESYSKEVTVRGQKKRHQSLAALPLFLFQFVFSAKNMNKLQVDAGDIFHV
jgi:hypothetical protein